MNTKTLSEESKLLLKDVLLNAEREANKTYRYYTKKINENKLKTSSTIKWMIGEASRAEKKAKNLRVLIELL